MNVFIAIIQEAYIHSNLLKNMDIFENENIKNLPNIEEMSHNKIKGELENRIILMNKGLNKYRELIKKL